MSSEGSAFASWLDDLLELAEGRLAPSAKDTVASMENACKDCSDDQLAGLSALLFPPEGSAKVGIVEILKRSLKDPQTMNKEQPRELRSEVLRFLELYIEEHTLVREKPGLIAGYVTSIVEVCHYVFRREVNNQVRELCFHPLLLALELKDFMASPDELSDLLFPPAEAREMGGRRGSLIDDLWKHHCGPTSKTSPTVRGACLKLLGRVARLFPVEASLDRRFADGTKGQIFRACVETLRSQTSGEAMERLAEVAGALEGLNGLLLEAELEPAELKLIFEQMLRCLEVDLRGLKRFAVPRAALSMLGFNIGQFAGSRGQTPDDFEACDMDAVIDSSLLLQHGERLWKPLHRLAEHDNVHLRRLAEGVLRETAHWLASQLCIAANLPEHQDRARTLYNFFVSHISKQVRSLSDSRVEGRYGSVLRLRAEFAAPSAALAGAADLREQLRELCRLTDDHFPTDAMHHSERLRRQVQGRLPDLPGFMDAFSLLLPHLQDVDEFAAKAMKTLALLVPAHFEKLGSRQRPQMAASLQRLLVTLRGKHGALEQLLQQMVFPALLISIDSNRSAAQPDHYAKHFWQPLMDTEAGPTRRFEEQARRRGHQKYHVRSQGKSARRSELVVETCGDVLEHLLRSVVRMLKSFDLAALPAESEDGAGGRAAATTATAVGGVPAGAAQGADGKGAAGSNVNDTAIHLTSEDNQAGNPLDSMLSVGGESLVVNVGDLYLFLSLIEFCCKLLPLLRNELLVRHVHLLILEAVELSARFPHVSGFYKLVRALIRVSEDARYFDRLRTSSSADISASAEPSSSPSAFQAAMEVPDSVPNVTRCYIRLRSFLDSLLERTQRFKDELLAAALELLLLSPRVFVVERMPSLSRAAQLALRMGHAYRPLAATAVEALERWLQDEPALLQIELPVLLPLLHAYLTIHAGGEERVKGVAERDAARSRKLLTNAHTGSGRGGESREHRSEDELLQLRIVHFVGQVGGDCVNMVRGSEDEGSEGRWDVQERARLTLPMLHDHKGLEVYVDCVLPRLVELATTSVSYREKAAACELLEASIKLCIGRNATSTTSADGDFSALYSKLFPAMLRLATDADGFARGLFEPLSLQVIHWFTQSERRVVRDTMILLDSVMAALCDRETSGLREFGARCLAEFVKYSIKHKTSTSTDSPQNIRSLMHRLFGLSQHPSSVRRLSFALAINATYRALREDLDTVDLFLLQLLQQTIIALKLSERDPPALGSVDMLRLMVSKLERVLLSCSDLLLKPNAQREAFADGLVGRDGFNGGFVHWLFGECVGSESHARLRCSQLLESVCSVIPRDVEVASAAKYSGSREWVQAVYGTRLRELPIVRRFGATPDAIGVGSESGVDIGMRWKRLSDGPPASPSSTATWFSEVQAALDCTRWTLKNGHLTHRSLLEPQGGLHAAIGILGALFTSVGGWSTLAASQPSSLPCTDSAKAPAAERAEEPLLCASFESDALVQAAKRDALKAAFRLLLLLLNLGSAGCTSSLLHPSSARAPPVKATGGEAAASASVPSIECALTAVLLPTRLGFDPSDLEECSRMRTLACQVAAASHKCAPTAFLAALRAALAAPGVNLLMLTRHVGLTQPLAVAAASARDTLELIAVVEGHLNLLRLDSLLLLPSALPVAPSELAERLGQLAWEAPPRLPPLEMQLLSKALELACDLGLSATQIMRWTTDESASGRAFGSRFRPVVLERLAQLAHQDDGRLRDLAGFLATSCGRRGMELLVEWLETVGKHPQMRVEPLVRAVHSNLPGLLQHIRWPQTSIVALVLNLFRKLTSLGGHLLSRDSSDKGVLHAWLALMRASRQSPSPLGHEAARAKVEGLRLLPSLLKWLRPTATGTTGLSEVVAEVRALLDTELPLSFFELDGEGQQQRLAEVQAVLASILDAVGDPQVHSVHLAYELLGCKAVVEQSFHRKAHALTEATESALRAFVQSVAMQPAASFSSGDGASVEEVWSRCSECLLCDGKAGESWQQRRAVLHSLALPLLHAVPAARLVPLLLPTMPALASLWTTDSWAARLPAQAHVVHAELVRRTAAFEFMAAITTRLPKVELEAGSRLAEAAGCDGPLHIKRMLPSAAEAAKKALVLPELDQDSMEVTHSLRTRLHAEAYAAFVDTVIATQTLPDKISKLLFNWQKLWENAVDPEAKLKLRPLNAMANLPGQTHVEQLAKAKHFVPPPARGAYLPSQMLLGSSLSQEILDDGAVAVAHKVGESSQVTAAAVQSQSQAPPPSQSVRAAAGTSADPDVLVSAATAGSAAAQADTGQEQVGSLDMDVLNSQLMVPVVHAAIEQLCSRGLAGHEDPPTWMVRLHEKISSPDCGYRVRLLIAKLVYNLRNLRKPVKKSGGEGGMEVDEQPELLFARHAGMWVKPLMQVVFESVVLNECFHYFARDLLELVCEWPARDQLTDVYLRQLLGHLLERLMRFCVDDRPDVLRANVKVIKRLLDFCGEHVQVRRLIILKLLRMSQSDGGDAEKSEVRHRLTGLFLLNAIVAEGDGRRSLPYADAADCVEMDGGAWVRFVPKTSDINTAAVPDDSKYEPATADKMRKALLKNLVDKRSQKNKAPRRALYEPAAQVVGMVLAQLRESEADGFAEFESEVWKVLQEMRDGTQEGLRRFLVVADRMSENYAEILAMHAGELGRCLQEHLNRVFGYAREHVLNCLARYTALTAPAHTAASRFVVSLSAEQLSQVLKQQQGGVQYSTLRVVTSLFEARGPQCVWPLVHVLYRSFRLHALPECRALYYELLIRLRAADTSGGSNATGGDGGCEIAADTNRAASVSPRDTLCAALLCGLDDADKDLREKMVSYWHEQLPQQLPQRLLACFEVLFVPDVADRWLHFCAVLLLRLSATSASYKDVDAIFDRGLCEGGRLQDYDVHPTIGSASLAMQPWGSMQLRLSQALSASQEAGGGMLRATQDLLFSQTQEGDDGGGLPATYSSQGASSVVLFGLRHSALPPVPLWSHGSDGGRRRATAEDGAAVGAVGAAAGGKRVAKATFEAESKATMRRRVVQEAKAARAQKVERLRQYKIGEMPDIKLSAFDFVEPLSSLCLHEPLVAKEALVHMYKAIRGQKIGDDERLAAKMHDAIASMLRSAVGGPAFVACLHELALTETEVDWLPPVLIADSAKRTGNLHTGVRLLEQQLLQSGGGARSAKRSRLPPASDVAHASADDDGAAVRVRLAELYQRLGSEDIVRSLAFEIAASAQLRAAMVAEARGDSEQALESFNAVVQDAAGCSAIEADQARRGRVNCLRMLARWSELKRETEPMVAVPGDLDSWRRCLNEPVLPLWIKAHTRDADDSDGGDGGASCSPSCLAAQHLLGRPPCGAHCPSTAYVCKPWPNHGPDPHKDAAALLEAGLGPLLLLERLSTANVNGARALLPQCIAAFVRRWSTLHPLATSARLFLLQQVQLIAEANELVTLLDAPLLEAGSRGEWHVSASHSSLLRAWRLRSPSELHHDVGVWEDLISARKCMLGLLERQLDAELRTSVLDESEREPLAATFAEEKTQCLVGLYELAGRAARLQGDFGAAKRYTQALLPLRKQLRERVDVGYRCGILQLVLDRERARRRADGRTEWVGELEKVAAQLQRMAASQLSSAPLEHRCEVLRMQASVAWELVDAADATDATAPAPAPGSSELVEPLVTAVAEAQAGRLPLLQLSDLRLRLADACDRAAQLPSCPAEVKPQHVRTAFRQVVAAMVEGSLAARERLPAVIAQLRSQPTLWEEAEVELRKPPLWMALKWTNQLVAMLNEPHGQCIAPLLSRLARLYPQAVVFPFRLSRPQLEERAGVLPAQSVHALRTMAADLSSEHLDGLVSAFEDLTHPNLRVKDACAGVRAKLRDGAVREALQLVEEEKAKLMGTGRNAAPSTGSRRGGRGEVRGSVLVDFAAELFKKGSNFSMLEKKLATGDADGARRLLPAVEKDAQALAEAKLQRHVKLSKLSLEKLSALLATYKRPTPAAHALDAIELPGQYSGEGEPHPDAHVYIDSFGPELLVMNSLRKPKRITAHGSDSNDRRFLVKGGEDLRLDQRVQTMFGLVNGVLSRDPACARRALVLRTYTVTPLSQDVGLIEWMDGTKPLKAIIEDAVKALWARAGAGARGARNPNEFKDKYLGEPFALFAKEYKDGAEYMHKLGSSHRSKAEWFAGIQARVKPDLLREGIAAMSVGAEAYLARRGAFAHSLAVLTIAGYVLGIGDRHLDNFMLELDTGRVVGIDFGHAFGSATSTLPVPELMAVRLTRQMMCVMQPLESGTLLKGFMEHVLRALRQRRLDMMRVLEVFIAEPLVDWQQQARRLNEEQKRGLAAADPGQLGESVSSSVSAPPGDGTGEPQRSHTSAAPHGELDKQFLLMRLDGVRRKLSGGNSALITVADAKLSVNSLVQRKVRELEETVLGPPNSKRRQLAGDGLTVEEQVEVLVEQATDPNILGRTWIGWAPWL